MLRVTTRGFSANALKWIAICAMLVDHIAWAFVPYNSIPGQVMHIVGRLTMPIMAFFIAQGYHYTRDVKRYTFRLGIFAVISHCPYLFFHTGHLLTPSPATSVIYPIFLSLLALIVNDHIKNTLLKSFLIFLLCLAAVPGDWMFMPILWALVFSRNTNNFKKQCLGFLGTTALLLLFMVMYDLSAGLPWYNSMYVLGVFLVLPLLALYNGQRGKGGRIAKWSFYILYPLHLVILGYLRFYAFK